MKIRGKIEKRDVLITGGLGLFPLILALDGILSRWDGVILLFVFAAYIMSLIRQRRYFDRPDDRQVTKKEFWQNVVVCILSILILLAAAAGVVEFGSGLAVDLGVSVIVIGVVFVAIGTSLPELAIEIGAVMRKKPVLAIGDVLGSVAMNSALVVGLTSLIRPIELEGFSQLLLPTIVFFVCYLIFTVLLFTREKLSSKEGIFMVFLYVIFLILAFLR